MFGFVCLTLFLIGLFLLAYFLIEANGDRTSSLCAFIVVFVLVALPALFIMI